MGKVDVEVEVIKEVRDSVLLDKDPEHIAVSISKKGRKVTKGGVRFSVPLFFPTELSIYGISCLLNDYEGTGRIEKAKMVVLNNKIGFFVLLKKGEEAV